jgi:hypothetical protein
MPTRVQVPGKGIVEFPDGMSADDMKSALEKLAPPDVKPKTWVDTAVDWLPAVGGAVGGIVGGIGGTVLGAGVGGVPGAIGGATLGAGAGEAYKQLINRARGQQAPATAPDAAKDIGVASVVQGALPEAAGAGIGAAASAVAPRIMQSALKPGLKTLVRSVKRGEDVPRVVQTLLDEGVNVSPGGVEKLNRLLNATNQEITAAVQSATGTIKANNVAARLGGLAQDFSAQAAPSADLETISRIGNDFLEHHGPTMSVQDAQAIKQGTYKQLGQQAYGQVSPAAVEAQKTIARGLKEDIAAEVPGIDALNAREGKILEALHETGRRAALSGNKDPIGLAWAVHNPTVFLAALMDRSAAVKSMLARGLYQSAGAAAKVSPQLIRAAVTALVSDPETTTDPGGQSQ